MPTSTSPSTASLQEDLLRLEGLLGSGGEISEPADRPSRDLPTETPAARKAPPISLAALGNPQRLRLLFQVLLGTLLRRGPQPPGIGLEPARLIESAAHAARVGELPSRTVQELRKSLRQASQRLLAADAWDAARPCWWHPLPPLSPFELSAEGLKRAVGSLRPEDLRRAFGREAREARWWVEAPFLAPERTRTLYQELEAAHLEGILPLEPGAVGDKGEVSALRSDSVGYFNGLEDVLLKAAPTAALLIQHLLEQIPSELRKAFPKKGFYPPQKAMLARYPAPSDGYAAHMDNPGGERDNHRLLTLVLYLNPPEAPPAGGDLALWKKGGDVEGPPATVVAAGSGTAALFDSREIPHQVLPLGPGPARWALALWLSDLPQAPPGPEPPPEPSVTDLLLPIRNPSLPEGRTLFHTLETSSPQGRLRSLSRGDHDLRAGIVCTTYRAGESLIAWCEHHLSLGFEHLLLIFDHLRETSETALAHRLLEHFPSRCLSIWDGEMLLQEGWPELPRKPAEEDLRRLATGGASSFAHAARQTLNASLALKRAQQGRLGDTSLDWLLHLDSDELFYLDGSNRGGATLREHLSAATQAGLERIRYANHELLLPYSPGSPPRFKLNPRLAAATLGPAGWGPLKSHLRMAQDDLRPYFRAYHNGKSAVSVEAARSAAGVHDWKLRDGIEGRSAFLAGPSVLHCHLPSAEAFIETYTTKAKAPLLAPGDRPFAPSPLEEKALDLLRETVNRASLGRHLEELYHQRTYFSPQEIELLEEAGLVIHPRLSGLSNG